MMGSVGGGLRGGGARATCPNVPGREEEGMIDYELVERAVEMLREGGIDAYLTQIYGSEAWVIVLPPSPLTPVPMQGEGDEDGYDG